jgi:hypothetical protein
MKHCTWHIHEFALNLRVSPVFTIIRVVLHATASFCLW